MPNEAIAQIGPHTRVIYCKLRAHHKLIIEPRHSQGQLWCLFQISGKAVKQPLNGVRNTTFEIWVHLFTTITTLRLSAGPRPRQFSNWGLGN